MAVARNKRMTNTTTGSESRGGVPYLRQDDQALRRYFVEGCSWETAAPTVKDPHRVADPSTLRRWFRELDSSQPPYAFLRRTLTMVEPWIRNGQILRHGD
jgi:hypothetical protein